MYFICLTSILAHLIPDWHVPARNLQGFPLAYKAWQWMAWAHTYSFPITFKCVPFAVLCTPSPGWHVPLPLQFPVSHIIRVVKNPGTRVLSVSSSSSTTWVLWWWMIYLSLCVLVSSMAKVCLLVDLLEELDVLITVSVLKLYLTQSQPLSITSYYFVMYFILPSTSINHQ